MVQSSASRPSGRVIGVVYLSYFLTAFMGAGLARGIVVPGNAAATANNILAHEAWYRAGLTVDLLGNAVYIALTALFYRLFEPVDRAASQLAAFFSLAGCTVQIGGGLLQLAPLVVLKDGSLLSAFTQAQVQAIALQCLKLHSQTLAISAAVFALYDLWIGYLIVRSVFLPRFLGLLMILAGVGWLLCVAWPPVATALGSYVIALGGGAEMVLTLWLLVKGLG